MTMTKPELVKEVRRLKEALAETNKYLLEYERVHIAQERLLIAAMVSQGDAKLVLPKAQIAEAVRTHRVQISERLNAIEVQVQEKR